jgi:hypothetical protein
MGRGGAFGGRFLEWAFSLLIKGGRGMARASKGSNKVTRYGFPRLFSSGRRGAGGTNRMRASLGIGPKKSSYGARRGAAKRKVARRRALRNPFG